MIVCLKDRFAHRRWRIRLMQRFRVENSLLCNRIVSLTPGGTGNRDCAAP